MSLAKQIKRNLWGFVLGGALALLLGLPSILIPHYLGHDAEYFSKSTSNADLDALSSLQDGYRLERAGNLEEALKNYRTSAKSKVSPIQQSAEQASVRVSEKLNALILPYRAIRLVQELSGWAASIMVVAVVIFGVVVGIRQWVPRRGIELMSIAIAPQIQDLESGVFSRLLVQEIGRIARAHSLDLFERIGAKSVMRDIKLGNEQTDALSRAASVAQQGEMKTMIGYVAAELVRWLKVMGDRPEFVISGAVTVWPGQALGCIQLTRAVDGECVWTWEASSHEALVWISRDSSLMDDHRESESAPQIQPREGAEASEATQHLSALATILACKIWHGLAEGTRAEMRPASWRTVYHLTEALTALEQAQ